MDNEPEMIRREMAETRASLTDKLETLENKVVGTVQDATSAVHETVEQVTGAVQETAETVKDTVSDTVDSVKDVFNVKLQVDRHPCLMMGAAVAVGYLGGSLLSRGAGHSAQSNGRHYPPSGSAWPDEGKAPPRWREDRSPLPAVPAPHAAEHGLTDLLGPELAEFKGMVVGFLMGLLRDAVGEGLPDAMRPQFHETMDRMTHKLGGQPIKGPVLECTGKSSTASARSTNGSEGSTNGGSHGDFRCW